MFGRDFIMTGRTTVEGKRAAGLSAPRGRLVGRAGFAVLAVAAFVAVWMNVDAAPAAQPGNLIVVRFAPQPAGSVVFVDGELKCAKTPCTTSLNKGTHTVKIFAEGFIPDTREIELTRDQTVYLELAPNFGWLVVGEQAAGLEIQVDGRSAGVAGRGRLQVPAGAHRVEVVSQCHWPASAEATVRKGEETKVGLAPQLREGAVDVSAEDEKGRPVSAEVFIDGVRAGFAPATFKVSTCAKDVEVRDGRHSDYRTTVKVVENRLTMVKAVLTDEPAPGVSGTGSEMIEIPAGGFWMGCNAAVDDQCSGDEMPYIRAQLRAFKIDKYEATVADYEKCVQSGGCSPANTGSTCNYGVAGRQNHPINCVDWVQAGKFCKWAGKRLPTEAEWEKAARGPGGLKYPWGNDPLDCDRAEMSAKGCKSDGTMPVGSHPAGASPYGVMDMIGNVWEWTADSYDEGYYKKSPGVDPVGPAGGKEKVLRGGSWYSSLSINLRASGRSHNYPGLRLDLFGIRCAQ